MAGKHQYSETEITEFIETAQLTGLAPAIKRMGYPSFPTAQRWFRERGIELPTIDSLMAKAAEMKVFYSDNEKKYALQAVMDAIVEKVQENDLDADSLNKLANGLAKILQTFQLIEGKSTAIAERVEKSETDKHIERLTEQMKKMNTQKEAELG